MVVTPDPGRAASRGDKCVGVAFIDRGARIAKVSSLDVLERDLVACRLAGWDPIVSAGYLSQLAGVLAGLVFAGIIVLLTDRADRTRRLRATMLLTSGLFAMIVASTLFALIAGIPACALASVLTAPVVGLLAVGFLAILGGIASLVDTYDSDGGAARVTNLGTYVVALVVVVFAAQVPQALTGGLRGPGLIDFEGTWFSPLYRYWPEVSAGLVLLTLIARPLIGAATTKRTGRRGPPGSRTGADRLAVAAAGICILYVAVAAAVVAYFLMFTEDSAWLPGASGHIGISGDAIRNIGYLAELVSTTAMVVLMLALPVRRRVAPTAPDFDPAPPVATATPTSAN